MRNFEIDSDSSSNPRSKKCQIYEILKAEFTTDVTIIFLREGTFNNKVLWKTPDKVNVWLVSIDRSSIRQYLVTKKEFCARFHDSLFLSFLFDLSKIPWSKIPEHAFPHKNDGNK